MNELFKTIEAQGKLITEIRAENENLKRLAERLAEYLEPHEEDHFEECVANDLDISDHIYLVIKEVNNLIK